MKVCTWESISNISSRDNQYSYCELPPLFMKIEISMSFNSMHILFTFDPQKTLSNKQLELIIFYSILLYIEAAKWIVGT